MNVFRKAVKDNRRGWLGWTLALTGIAAMYSGFWPSIGTNPEMGKAIDSFPQSLKDAFHLADYSKPENYFGATVFGLLVPVLAAVFAISAATLAIAGDEEAGTLDLVLAHPVSRVSLALQRIAAVFAALVVVVGGLSLAVIGLRGPAEFTALQPGKILAIGLQLALFGMFFAALAFAAGAWTGRKAVAIGVGAGFAVFSYLGDSFLPQISGLKWTERFSAFEWYLGGEPLRNGVQTGHALLLLGLSAALVALGVWRFDRRDIAV